MRKRPNPSCTGEKTEVLIVTPPLVHCNSPYSSGPRLAGFLRSRGIAATQWDASLDLILLLMSAEGLRRVAAAVRTAGRESSSVRSFLRNRRRYVATVDSAIAFLQGTRPELASAILSRRFLPEGPRFSVIAEIRRRLEHASTPERDPIRFFFGDDMQAAARYLASLYVDDIADAIRDGVDQRFGLSRFAEELTLRAASFNEIRRQLQASGTLIDAMMEEMTDLILTALRPALLAITIPFPGAFYGALRIAARARKILPETRVAIGGGFVTRDLRQVHDPRLFEHVDHVVCDAGELRLLDIVLSLAGERSRLPPAPAGKKRTEPLGSHLPRKDPAPDAAAPDYSGLDLRKYVSLSETPNPMIRMWTEGKWIRMSLADGCYWARCAFCDIAIPSVRRFNPSSPDRLARCMEKAVKATGWRGVHFTDEAAPPALLRRLSLRLIHRGPSTAWWVNIRFEPPFTPELAQLMRRAGCVAVTGGLEAANDRLLRLLRKGITLAGAVRVMRAFRDAGIMVHAYLMYGCPTQTVQETVDALELVRQLFENRCLVSCHWHRFALGQFSPIALAPERYGIRLAKMPIRSFVCDSLNYRDSVRCDHDMLGRGLRKAAYNYMLGFGLDMDVRLWFENEVPAPTIPGDAVLRMLGDRCLSERQGLSL